MDYYKVLGVPSTASLPEIRKSYIQLSLKYHPDRNDSPSAEEEFKKVSEAYYILSDETRRKEYDLDHKTEGNVDATGVFASVFDELLVPESN